ncbi:MAG: hypothetical protein AAB723_03450 [Patescibacteria group bacterium]
MAKTETKYKNKSNILSDEEVRNLVMARLSVLSQDTMISLGEEGSFTRDEMLERIKEGDEVGEKLAEIQLEWLRSFKNNSSYEIACD